MRSVFSSRGSEQRPLDKLGSFQTLFVRGDISLLIPLVKLQKKKKGFFPRERKQVRPHVTVLLSSAVET